MAKNRFSESHGILPLTKDGSWNAGFDTDSIDMAKYNHACVIIYGDTSVATDDTIGVYGGASAGTKTALCRFDYRYGSAAAGSANSDVYGTVASVAAGASLTATAASLAAGYVLLIEFDAADLQPSTTQYRYATLQMGTGTGSGGTIDVVAILSEPRYLEAVMDTAQA